MSESIEPRVYTAEEYPHGLRCALMGGHWLFSRPGLEDRYADALEILRRHSAADPDGEAALVLSVFADMAAAFAETREALTEYLKVLARIARNAENNGDEFTRMLATAALTSAPESCAGCDDGAPRVVTDAGALHSYSGTMVPCTRRENECANGCGCDDENPLREDGFCQECHDGAAEVMGL